MPLDAKQIETEIKPLVQKIQKCHHCKSVLKERLTQNYESKIKEGISQAIAIQKIMRQSTAVDSFCPENLNRIKEEHSDDYLSSDDSDD